MPPFSSPDTQRTYTLTDLEEAIFPLTPLAVIGHPIRHSLSPLMHNAALADLSKKNASLQNWCYYRLEIPPEKLPKAVGLFHAQKFQGLNLTLPHKVEVIPHLFKIDPLAKKMGAVNTLLWHPDGYWGFNTDGHGLESALRKDLNVTLNGEDVILLGAGGAARAAAVQCIERECRSLWIANRNKDRLNQLLHILHQHYPNALIKTFSVNDTEALRNLPIKATLINATSLGLRSEDPVPINLNDLTGSFFWHVYDMVYRTDSTPLVKHAKMRGWPAVNGLGMLVWQGAYALKIWSGLDPSVNIMREAIETA